ncbi:MAG TPA: Swt1 family HEPN domain-containing protein [Candidatus Binataceae bacterium]|nr:Swt1 family HEPN domain-containing protein [Candidatus Binataceae bacterium]
MKVGDAIKLFGMTQQLIESDLDSIEKLLSIDLGRTGNDNPFRDEDYFPQFGEQVRLEAAAMSKHYEIFYCLEKSLRQLIKAKLEAERGANWWSESVPTNVKSSAEANMKRELDSGVTMRSADLLDYTTFGELGEIVRMNWSHFNDTFNSQGAFNKIMASLNTLRGPIAHCSPLADDEVARLRLTMRDWFRLME